MPAMRAEDRIFLIQMRTHAGRNRLLSDIRMARAVNQPPLMASREFFFRLPDDLHGPVETEGSGQWAVGSGGRHGLCDFLKFADERAEHSSGLFAELKDVFDTLTTCELNIR